MRYQVVSSKEAAERDDVIWITSTSDKPWCLLDPDYQHGGIPVPCISGHQSETIRGVWEGLKATGSKHPRINFAFFSGPGRSRVLGEDERLFGWHWYGRTIGQTEAISKILLPTYMYVIENQAKRAVHQLKEMETATLCDICTLPVRPSELLASMLNNEFLSTGTKT